ncbi:hypothetical protein AZE42_06840 [Rhizopogon vesiculosus]|uniref:Uncharacterized protein n=1 Tax=Rhizopogon vesiculosus TaxID=180088 RepID=A0A1J8QB19_9AGAM|nr:hypothetical protein AZE42_06840 [Rhizopogon vesiculosus]
MGTPQLHSVAVFDASIMMYFCDPSSTSHASSAVAIVNCASVQHQPYSLMRMSIVSSSSTLDIGNTFGALFVGVVLSAVLVNHLLVVPERSLLS